MKIAVASTGSHVARHFALCESFHIYMVYGGKIMKETDIPNPGLRPAMLPEFLEKQKVNAVICGGMGGRTEELCREKRNCHTGRSYRRYTHCRVGLFEEAP